MTFGDKNARMPGQDSQRDCRIPRRCCIRYDAESKRQKMVMRKEAKREAHAFSVGDASGTWARKVRVLRRGKEPSRRRCPWYMQQMPIITSLIRPSLSLPYQPRLCASLCLCPHSLVPFPRAPSDRASPSLALSLSLSLFPHPIRPSPIAARNPPPRGPCFCPPSSRPPPPAPEPRS